MYSLFLLSIFSPVVLAIIGFDCGGPFVNITTVSLLSAGECDLNIKTILSEPTQVQLLQAADYEFTETMQCRISVSRLIFYCGMHSHVSAVHNGHAEYLREVPYQQCKRMHLDGTLTLGNNVLIEGLKANSTTTRSVTLAGSVSTDGKCSGSTYSDPYGSWTGVVVQATLKITLRTAKASIKANSGTITLRSGTTCNLADTYCIDLEDGYTYWNPTPEVTCNFDQYDLLYEGIAQKIHTNDSNSPVIYSMTTQDVTFALTKTIETKFCGYTLLRTEHPKLFIIETKPGNSFSRRRPVPVENLDIFTYVNSKFVYVEKHLRTQMTTLYNDVMMQKCDLERRVITNALALAPTQPENFAHEIMKGPGYMAVAAGEVIHIIKCIPVEVKLRATEACYNELPVTFKNASYFLTPKNHILKKIGTTRECHRLLPVTYKVDDSWIRFLPTPLDAQQPITLKPQTKLTWTYLTPEKLATSGIYSEEQIAKLREHIMFPAEKSAILNNVVHGISGKEPLEDGMSLYNLLDEKTLNKIAESTAHKIWYGFVTFGSASAGLIGIFIIIKLIKLILDTLIHGYALHSVYGCSIHLLGAVWSSVTHLLLHLGRQSPSATPKDIEADLPTFHAYEDLRPPTPILTEAQRPERDHTPMPQKPVNSQLTEDQQPTRIQTSEATPQSKPLHISYSDLTRKLRNSDE